MIHLARFSKPDISKKQSATGDTVHEVGPVDVPVEFARELRERLYRRLDVVE